MLAARAALGGALEVSGAGELRVKESDRITALVCGPAGDGRARPTNGRTDSCAMAHGRPAGGTADAAHDHRLVMAFTLVGLGCDRPLDRDRRRRGRRLVPRLHDRPGEPHVVTTDKIYLVGFMAAGKSTVARALGARLDWRAEDIDDLHRDSGTDDGRRRSSRGTASRISARVERELLRLLQPIRHVVVATGGGTFADPENRALINMDGVSVWLDVPLADIIARIPQDGRRPLAADRAQFERLYLARTDAYRLAHVRVPAARVSPAAIVDHILDAIAALGPVANPPPPRA